MFRGSEFLYTLRLASGKTVLAHVPSHHDHRIGEWIGIRAQVDHVVTFNRACPQNMVTCVRFPAPRRAPGAAIMRNPPAANCRPVPFPSRRQRTEPAGSPPRRLPAAKTFVLLSVVCKPCSDGNTMAARNGLGRMIIN